MPYVYKICRKSRCAKQNDVAVVEVHTTTDYRDKVHCKKSSRVSRRQALRAGVKRSGWRFFRLFGLPIPFDQSYLGLLTANMILFCLTTGNPIILSCPSSNGIFLFVDRQPDLIPLGDRQPNHILG
jgi:hypothetical protein